MFPLLLSYASYEFRGHLVLARLSHAILAKMCTNFRRDLGGILPPAGPYGQANSEGEKDYTGGLRYKVKT